MFKIFGNNKGKTDRDTTKIDTKEIARRAAREGDAGDWLGMGRSYGQRDTGEIPAPGRGESQPRAGETEKAEIQTNAARVSQGADLRNLAENPGPFVQSGIRLEIDALQKVLQAYGFGFAEMKDGAPASKKTRQICREAVCFLLEEGQMEYLRKKRHLPMQNICDYLQISPKKIERHRKYIIAVCEILDGDFPHLAEFLGETRAMLVRD